MRKKILLITDEMEMGGTQKQITNLLLNIDKTNIDIELIYFTNESELVSLLANNDIRVTKINKKKSIDIKFIINLVSYVRKGKFDVIHAFAISAEFWGFVAYLLSPTKTLITSIRGVYEWYSIKHWFLKSLYSCFSYRVVGNSKAGIKYAKAKMWCSKNNYELVYNGITTNKKNMLEDYCFEKNIFYILSVGRLIKGKNNALLIDAAEDLSKKHTDFKVLIIGDGPDRENLQNKIDAINCNCVELLGEKNNVSYYMKNSSLLVHPSLREGLSNAILEAFANELLVLVSDADGNKELVENEKTGLLFENNNRHDLMEKINLVINKKDDYRDCVSNAKDSIENMFSIKSMCKKYQNLYEK